MADKPRPEDFLLLGVGPEVTAEELERSYNRIKALYSEGSLATYSLLDDEERNQLRDRIEEARLRIGLMISHSKAASSSSPPASAPKAAPAPIPHGGAKTEPAASAGASGGASAPPATEGGRLRRIREEKGITLREISTRSRIRTTHLENIEKEDFSQLPAPVYLRGFLIEYARHLGLPDPEAAAARYLDRYLQWLELH